jgi:hypothetical protein
MFRISLRSHSRILRIEVLIIIVACNFAPTASGDDWMRNPIDNKSIGVEANEPGRMGIKEPDLPTFHRFKPADWSRAEPPLQRNGFGK